MVPQALKIDLTEQFPRLSHAPITEAVVEVRAHAEVPWEESGIRSQLAPLLPGYQKLSPRVSLSMRCSSAQDRTRCKGIGISDGEG